MRLKHSLDRPQDFWPCLNKRTNLPLFLKQYFRIFIGIPSSEIIAFFQPFFCYVDETKRPASIRANEWICLLIFGCLFVCKLHASLHLFAINIGPEYIAILVCKKRIYRYFTYLLSGSEIIVFICRRNL
jgi:hypothetical protein